MRRFLRLQSADRRLVAEAAFLLVTARVGLAFLPVRGVVRLLSRMTSRRLGEEGGHPSVQARVCWAVRALSPWVRGSTCLVQALVAGVLCRRLGHPVELRMGMARGPEGGIEGHAWLECRGIVVLGGPDASRYVPLTGAVSQPLSSASAQ